MTPRLGLILAFFLILAGCSEKTSEQDAVVVAAPKVNTPKSSGEEAAVSVVCGVLYQVKDFDVWIEEYRNVAAGTIILLRNVDDPSIVVVFEGRENYEQAKARGVELTSEAFLTSAGIEDNPVTTYDKVQYYKPPISEFKQHVALQFDFSDINMLISRLERDSDLFAQYGLTVMGVGTDMENEEAVYLLLTLEDFVSFRQQTNSPRKMNKFIENLNLPPETFISDWTKTSL